jgi:menaquinone-9 beta-reductase
MTSEERFDVVIAGAGPAGSSAATRLCQLGLKVALVDRQTFPRPKLCGEFITPECLPYLRSLGVAERELTDAASITKVRFHARNGHTVTIPCSWLHENDALGLSRAVFDELLVRRAKESGVHVIEGARASLLMDGNGDASGVKLRSAGTDTKISASLIVDATGRSRDLIRSSEVKPRADRSRHIAVKVHLAGTRIERDTCEMYAYPSGYGGLNAIENGLANLCFITDAELVKRHQNDLEILVDRSIGLNPHAKEALRSFNVIGSHMSVPIGGYGVFKPTAAKRLFAIGDSAGFIDPFTGSGILMALQSATVFSDSVSRVIGRCGEIRYDEIAREYSTGYARLSRRRFTAGALFRRALFDPRLGDVSVKLLTTKPRLLRLLTRATRHS